MTPTGATAMTLAITDTTMTSAHSARAARHAPDRNGWEVSWLPGQILDRTTAVTAMTLAGTAAGRDLHDRHRLWPHIHSWAGELGLTASEAIARASQPPSGINCQHEPASRQSDHEVAD